LISENEDSTQWALDLAENEIKCPQWIKIKMSE